jgi:hypothetical protein
VEALLQAVIAGGTASSLGAVPGLQSADVAATGAAAMSWPLPTGSYSMQRHNPMFWCYHHLHPCMVVACSCCSFPLLPPLLPPLLNS